MIILLCDTVNQELSQDYYDSRVQELDRSAIKCPHCKNFGFYVNSYYERSFKIAGHDVKTPILIMQVICKNCGKTHAILLSSMIPWSQIPLYDALTILQLVPPAEESILVSHEDRIRLKKLFRLFWKERLAAFNIKIDPSLSSNCIFYHARQFMQIHCGFCFSVPPVHIAFT